MFSGRQTFYPPTGLIDAQGQLVNLVHDLTTREIGYSQQLSVTNFMASKSRVTRLLRKKLCDNAPAILNRNMP